MPDTDREEWLAALRELELLVARIEALPVSGSELRPFRRALRSQGAACLEQAHNMLSMGINNPTRTQEY